MPPSMPPMKNRCKRKNAAPPFTQTEEQTVVTKPSTENGAPPQNPPPDDSKSENQISVIHVTCVSFIWSYERTVRIYTPLIWSYCKRNGASISVKGRATTVWSLVCVGGGATFFYVCFCSSLACLGIFTGLKCQTRIMTSWNVPSFYRSDQDVRAVTIWTYWGRNKDVLWSS